MHDEWGAETETSMTLKINRINNLKTAINIGDNIFNKKYVSKTSQSIFDMAVTFYYY